MYESEQGGLPQEGARSPVGTYRIVCDEIIPYYYIEFNGPVMASMKIKTVQTILLSAM